MSLASPSISPQDLMALIGTPHAPLIFDIHRRAGSYSRCEVARSSLDEYATRIPMGREVVVCAYMGIRLAKARVGINARKLEGFI